jgi:hypothetical protein
MPNADHSQTNSSWPAAGSGHVHHREMKECGPPPPAVEYKTRAPRLAITIRAAAEVADGPAAIGELQAEPEGVPVPGQVKWAGLGPDSRGQEDLDPGGEG